MTLYLFTAIDKAYRKDFQQTVRLQNLKVTGWLARFVGVTCLLLFASALVINYNKTLPGVWQYYAKVLLFLFCTAFACITTIALVQRKTTAEKLVRYHFITLLYSLLFITGCMWFTFVQPNNLRSTLVMMVVGLVVISVLMVFNWRELLLIAGTCGTVFVVACQHYQVMYTLQVFSFFVLAFITMAFLLIARMLYSYHVNYYLQIRIIAEQNKVIAQVSDVKSDILAQVVHDLRNPVSAIRAVLGLLNDYPHSEKQKEEYVHWMQQSCAQAEIIIDELINAARQKNISGLQTQCVSLNEWLETICDQWQRRLPPEKQLQLKLPGKAVHGNIHTANLQRAVDNIIHNAVKFTPAEGNITLGLNRYHSGVRITIADNGIGIPEALLPTLFDRFSASGRAGVANESSSGLGLHVSKQLIEAHGGSLTVTSHVNEGSVFNIHLPFSIL
ncbi:sensor histidine kinase [Deminuibacter soli]|uniref:histidine kinase n=1 Tax=Deminuibacter soli TaxID=2291815 RepID=A0A3E1NHC5_9BACT|nr:HAMP domain-containing sensor histidine kinase [Deminuibacter soli]RFM27366.1 sensor histidine kinase [Deminuibacter soli]